MKAFFEPRKSNIIFTQLWYIIDFSHVITNPEAKNAFTRS